MKIECTNYMVLSQKQVTIHRKLITPFPSLKEEYTYHIIH